MNLKGYVKKSKGKHLKQSCGRNHKQVSYGLNQYRNRVEGPEIKNELQILVQYLFLG
jgi:hypothetical protein